MSWLYIIEGRGRFSPCPLSSCLPRPYVEWNEGVEDLLTFRASEAAANLASREASVVLLFLRRVSGTAIC